MFIRAVIVWVMMLGFAASLRAQGVDDALIEQAGKIASDLQDAAKPLVPEGTEISLWIGDGRMFAWNIELPGSLDITSLGKAIGVDAVNQRAVLDTWSERLHPKLLKLATDAVTAAGHDAHFNPETDVKVAVYGAVLPATTPDPEPYRNGSFYTISFTGSRRNERRDENGKVLREADGEPRGGAISVTIAVDHPVWKLRQTITGRVSIKNTGSTRVSLSSWWVEGIEVMNEAGQAARFAMRGHVSPAGDGPVRVFLNAGDEVREKFSIHTDQMHSMEHGYILGEGTWRIEYPPRLVENVKVVGDPAVVEVRSEPGEYLGPRILRMVGCGMNLVVVREEGWIEVFDAARGERLGTKRLTSYVPGWMWRGSQLNFSSDGRLVAYCKDRKSPVIIESVFGDPPPRDQLPPPDGVVVGAGGYFPIRFLPGDSKLLCVTNRSLTVMDLATAKALGAVAVPEVWTESSRDGRFAVWVEGSLGRLIGHRGDDEYTLHVVDSSGAMPQRNVTIKGHGPHPELHMGTANAYLSDEFESSVVMTRLLTGEVKELKTGAPADVIGESADGSVVALAWPRSEDEEEQREATTVGVYRTSDGVRICVIRNAKASGVTILSDPPRIVFAPRSFAGDGLGSASWLGERVRIHDALTGKLMGETDLTPKTNAFPASPPK